MTHSKALIDTLAKGCFLMGVDQTIRVMRMQKNPATLTEAIKEAMQLELINEMTRAKANIASLADMEAPNWRT
jgi:hypothetical protein